MLWKNSINCVITGYSKNHVNLNIEDERQGKWRITAFYEMLERINRRHSWDLIRSIYASSSLHWCLIGEVSDMVSFGDK